MRWNRRLGLTLLAAFSIICAVVPTAADFVRRLLTPVLAVFHQPSRNLGLKFSRAAAEAGDSSAAATEADDLAEENVRLRAAVAQLTEETARLKELNTQLSALREDLFPDGKFVIAALPVVSRDAVPSRESLLLRKPAGAPWDRLTRGQWAMSRVFVSVGQGDGEKTFEDAAVFWDKTLVGRVDSVAGGYCRIKLLTDPDFQSPAELVGRQSGKVFECLLAGKGEGLMIAKYVELAKAQVAVGDFVRIPAGRSGLPSAMIVGEVTRCGPDPAQPLLYRIEVAPTVDGRKLPTVLVAGKL
jgi:cell shape-determining protein MreC